ncbi:hypothetical protein Acr_02g0002400 [Actinidia rufa]|uniref:Protein FAR1-RELATED SEQUENCE n=1 Tax=Actinidia rufa TaxID=165716 RepID=A0A7J0E6F7_9ERIC|nr:hypothetical protein Acr_02g0002400 [Actinidia rufa]
MEESFGLYDFEVEDLQTPNNNVESMRQKFILETSSTSSRMKSVKSFVIKVEDVGATNRFQSFVVKSKVSEMEKFVVTLDSQTYEGRCECQNFEFVGILCTHMLKVFVRLDIDAIPDHFIFSRWRQKANKFRIIDSKELVHDDGKEESEALRLSHMCQESTKLACLAAPSNEAYTIYIETMNGLFEKLIKVTSCAPPMDACLEKDNVHTTDHSQILIQ